MRAILLQLLLLGWVFLPSAHAFEPRIYWDDDTGIPRCVEQGLDSRVLVWDDEPPYHRAVYACRIPEFNGLGCFNWDRWVTEQRSRMDCDKLNLNSPGLPLPAEAISALKQVERGARINEERSPKEYLRDNPIETWDYATNRALVRQFGMGYVSEMFKAWVEKQPGNAEFKAKLTERILEESRGQGPDIAARYKNHVIIYCPGLGHVQGAPSPIADYLSSLGIEVHIMNTLSRGSLADNRAIILHELVKYLNEGKTLLLAAESKGTSELLGALLELQGMPEYKSGLAKGGKVEAIISFSANFRGSFLADIFEASLLKPIAQILAGVLKAFKIDISEVLVGIHNCASKVIDAYYRDSAKRGGLASMHFPDEWTFIQYSGILPGDGLSSHAEVRRVQGVIQDFLPRSVGANDGLLEYPSTLMKPEWAKNQLAAVAYGSHFMIDGSYEGLFQFSNPKEVLYILRGLLNATLDQVEGTK